MSPGFVWPLRFGLFLQFGRPHGAPRAPDATARLARGDRNPDLCPLLRARPAFVRLSLFRAVQPARGWWKTVLTHRGHRGRAAASARRAAAAARAQRTRSERPTPYDRTAERGTKRKTKT